MKIGIEIHQRLDTDKLFCACSANVNNEGKKPGLVLLRRLHPVHSELGEMDFASKMESEKEKTFEYHAYTASNCLVETDEEPPHPLNREALHAVLDIALHLKCKPVDEIHVMRKIVIDGSNTSGFQRTALVALGGKLETSKGEIGITQVAIEEESAGIVETAAGKGTFRLDRLGIPLIEITTDPDIKDGEHLVEVAEKIGMIMRATGKVARGLGTIRQDVNISTEGGARIEIKGAQDLKMLPAFAKEEVRRQQELLAIVGEVKKRFKGQVYLEREFRDATRVFTNTESKLVKAGISAHGIVLALKLPHHHGLLGKEIQTGRRYGTELSDYAKSAGVKGITHSDEKMDKYQISEKEVLELRKLLSMKEDDAFVLVVAPETVAKRALHQACNRAEMMKIPEETRRANPDGSTSYMRPLPGRARMYPETDIPTITVTAELLKAVDRSRGESLEEKKDKLAKLLNPQMAEVMLKSRNIKAFEKLVSDFPKIEPMLIASTLENTLVSLRREGVELSDPETALADIFTAYSKGKFVKAAIPEVLKLVVSGKTIDEAVKDGGLARISGKELEKLAKENDYDVQKIMQKYRLRVEPSDLQKLKK